MSVFAWGFLFGALSGMAFILILVLILLRWIAGGEPDVNGDPERDGGSIPPARLTANYVEPSKPWPRRTWPSCLGRN